MAGFCPNCGKQVIWGVTPTGSKIALSAQAIRRYVFLYAPPQSVVDEVETYQLHGPDCQGGFKVRKP